MKLGDIEIKLESDYSSTDLSVFSLLKAAFDSTETVRFIVDASGTVLHFNRKAFENSILIHNKELKKGDNLFHFAADTNNKIQNHLKAQLERAFDGETFVVEHEVKYKSYSRWFQTEYAPILQNQKIVAASLSTFDITERKETEWRNSEVLAEIRSTSQHRIQQIEISLDTIIKRDEELASVSAKSNDHFSLSISRLFKDLLALRNKMKSWK